MSDDAGSAGERNWGDAQREQAALLAGMAEANDEIAHLLRDAVDGLAPGIDSELASIPVQIADAMQSGAYRLRTFQRLAADTAHAYDEFVAAGGEDNPGAHARWREVIDRATTLIPSNSARHDLSS